MRRTRNKIFLSIGLLPLLLLNSCGSETLKVEALYSGTKTTIAQIKYEGEATLECVDIPSYDTSVNANSDEPIYHFSFNDDISADEVTLHMGLVGRNILSIKPRSDGHGVTLLLGGDCSASADYEYGWVSFAPSCFTSEQYDGYTVYCRVKTGEMAIFTSMSTGNVDLP